MESIRVRPGREDMPVIGFAGLTQPKVSDAPPDSQTAPQRRPSVGEFALQFTGSGSEYFRIWIVNLLLTLVTLGIYHPFAKVRKLRYFYGNTSIAGHSFDFHGNGRRMLRGYALVGVMLALYGAAGEVSETAGLVALLIVAGVWPALFRSSMQFRLANTSWRGLRFSFTGDMAGAYKAMLPLFVPAALFLGAMAFVPVDEEGQAADGAAAVAGIVMMVAMLGVAVLGPLFLCRLKRYQHDHYQVGAVRVRMTAGARDFYKLSFKTGGVSLLAGLLVFAACAIVAGVAGVVGGGRAAALAFGVGAVLAYLATVIVVQPYMSSRLQNLVWSNTESRSLRFESQLGFLPFLKLTLKNWLLTLITLGFYWPFAAVATARMRLEAVTLVANTDLDSLVARRRDDGRDATGDAAGDLMGIDIGL